MILSLDKFFNYALHKNMRFIYIFLGFITSFPIFINPLKLNLFIKKIIINGQFEPYPWITTSMSDGIYLPIGFFSSSLLFLTIILNFRKKNLFYLSILLILFLTFLRDIGIPRTVGLFFSISFIYLSLTIIFDLNHKSEKNSENIKYFLFSYIIGFIFLCTSNILSTTYVHYFGLTGAPALRHHHIFSYEFYQYYVSFPAIMSLMFSLSVVLFLLNIEKRINIISIIIIILSSIISYFTLRKIFLIDLFVLLIFLTIYFLFVKKKTHNKIRFLCVYVYTILHLFFLFQYTIKLRMTSTLIEATRDRLFVYNMFVTELNYLDLKSLLFGYQQGFGGYSNFLIDMFVRVGFFGLAVLMFIILILTNYIINLSKKVKNFTFKFNYLYLVFYSFLLIFFILGNILNLNVMVPYYFVNLSIIIMFFNYLICTNKKYDI